MNNNFIPIVIPFERDELLYSWVDRLYKTNLYPNRFSFEDAYFNGQSIHVDGFGFSRGLFLSSRLNKKQEWVYSNHTLYPFFAIFYSKEKQEKILNIQRSGFEKDSPIAYFNEEAKEIRYCPECMKEAGRRYLKRAHQLPGVKVCYKHRCKLETLEKKYNREEMTDLENIPLKTDDSYEASFAEMQHAILMKNILDARFDMNREDLELMISKRLKTLKLFTKEEILEFFREKGVEVSDLQGSHLKNYPEGLSEEFLQTIMTPLFETIYVFKMLYDEVVDSSFNEELMKKLKAEGYEIISSYKKNLLEVYHEVCGTSFLMTEHGLKAGLRCPICAKLSNEDLYKALFSTRGDEFQLLSPYRGPKAKVRIKHSCGHIFEANPNAFYYNHGGCPKCRRKLTLNEAQEKVNDVDPTYELLSYDSLESKATFLHKTCGHKLDRRFNDFLRKGMYCPHCQKQAVKSKSPEFETKLKELVGDDYELVGPYNGDRQPIKIRHKDCGLVTEYPRAAYFLGGQRCPLCHGTLSNEEVEDYVSARSNGTYSVLDFLPASDMRILNVKADKSFTLKKKVLLQELARPTSSEILPCETDDAIERPLSIAGRFFKQVKKFYNNKSFRPKDMMNMGWTKSQTTKSLRKLVSYGLVENHDGNYRIIQEKQEK